MILLALTQQQRKCGGGVECGRLDHRLLVDDALLLLWQLGRGSPQDGRGVGLLGSSQVGQTFV